MEREAGIVSSNAHQHQATTTTEERVPHGGIDGRAKAEQNQKPHTALLGSPEGGDSVRLHVT